MRVRIGVDVGATKVLAAAVADDGEVLATERSLTGEAGGPALAATTVRTVRRLLAHPDLPAAAVLGVGVGVPGIVDPVAGTVADAANLGIGRPFALRDALRAALATDVRLDNDVNAATLGALRVLGRPGLDLAYLSVGTGLAAGLVLAGTLRRGARGGAGEVGHVVVDPAGRTCGCGQRGCLETLASGTWLAARWPRTAAPAAHLVATAAAGDPAAVAVLEELAGHLATAVQWLGLAVDPDVVVLGGGVATDGGAGLREAVAAVLRRRAEGSSLLRSLDLAGRLLPVPRDLPVGALGAAFLLDEGSPSLPEPDGAPVPAQPLPPLAPAGREVA